MNRYDPPKEHAVGARWDLPVTISGKDGAPLNLTGGTVSAALVSGSVVVRPATAIAVASQTESTGLATASFIPSETARLRPGRVRYEIRVDFDSANGDIVAWGYINAVKTVL